MTEPAKPFYPGITLTSLVNLHVNPCICTEWGQECMKTAGKKEETRFLILRSTHTKLSQKCCFIAQSFRPLSLFKYTDHIVCWVNCCQAPLIIFPFASFCVIRVLSSNGCFAFTQPHLGVDRSSHSLLVLVTHSPLGAESSLVP